MPSGWQSLPVDIFPVHRCPYNPFSHIRCPIYHMLPSYISSAAVYIPVVLHLRHRACPPLSSPLTLSSIPTSCVYAAVLITSSSIFPCTSPLLFVYLLRSDLLLALCRSVRGRTDKTRYLKKNAEIFCFLLEPFDVVYT